MLKELREKMARLLTQARAKLDEITDDMEESRVAEIETEYERIMAEHDATERKLEQQTRLAAAEARARDFDNSGDPRAPQGRNASGDGGGDDPSDGEISYRDAFHAMLRAGGDVSEMDPREREVLRAGVQQDAEFRAQTAGSNAAGGYTVPTELSAVLIETMAMWGPMYDEDVCTVVTTSGGNAWDLPTVDDTGVNAEAHTEGAALTDDGGKDVTFGKKTLNAYVFDTEFIKFSMELASDSIFNIETVLDKLLGKRLGRIANSQLTIGTGSGAPNGIVTASGLGKTAAATGAITFDEIIDLEHSVDPAYRQSPKARYMFNDSTLNAVRKLKDGDGNYLWQMGDVQKGTPGSFNGKPYSINQAMDSLGAAKKVMLFGDFSEYYVRKVGDPIIGVMRERFWPNLGIAGLVRFDGELGDSAAVKHLITAAS